MFAARWAPRLSFFGKEYAIVPRFSVSATEQTVALARDEGQRLFEAAFSALDEGRASGSRLGRIATALRICSERELYQMPTRVLRERMALEVRLGRLLLLDADRIPSPAQAAPPLAKATAPQDSALDEARTATFEVIFLDALTGAPVPGIALRVRRPMGDKSTLSSDEAGSVRLTKVELGRCEVTSIVNEARVADAYAVKPGGFAPPAATSAIPHRESTRRAPACLARLTTHRVATGDTPESIARKWNLTWGEIAFFNWGTQDPGELEICYRRQLGCRKRRPDGQGYRFDDGDEPGVIFIPVPWEARLEVGPIHHIYVEPIRPVYVSLDNEHGLAVPGVPFEVRFTDGSIRRGHLGRSGIARLTGVPDRAYGIAFPDQLAVLASSLAASVRRAFDDQATAPLFHLLAQSQEVVERAKAVYEEHFNDLTGRGLEADIDQVVTDPDARPPLLALCALAGMRIQGSEDVILPPGRSSA